MFMYVLLVPWKLRLFSKVETLCYQALFRSQQKPCIAEAGIRGTFLAIDSRREGDQLSNNFLLIHGSFIYDSRR